MDTTKDLPCKFIRPIDVALRSKRPDKNPPPNIKWALINTCAGLEQEIPQRLILGQYWNNKLIYRELVAVVQVFESFEEASAFARKEAIPCALLTNELSHPVIVLL